MIRYAIIGVKEIFVKDQRVTCTPIFGSLFPAEIRMRGLHRTAKTTISADNCDLDLQRLLLGDTAEINDRACWRRKPKAERTCHGARVSYFPRLGNMGVLMSTCITLIVVIPRSGIAHRSTLNELISDQIKRTRTSTAFGVRVRLPKNMA
jgi:hypothetical protein